SSLALPPSSSRRSRPNSCAAAGTAASHPRATTARPMRVFTRTLHPAVRYRSRWLLGFSVGVQKVVRVRYPPPSSHSDQRRPRRTRCDGRADVAAEVRRPSEFVRALPAPWMRFYCTYGPACKFLTNSQNFQNAPSKILRDPLPRASDRRMPRKPLLVILALLLSAGTCSGTQLGAPCQLQKTRMDPPPPGREDVRPGDISMRPGCFRPNLADLAEGRDKDFISFGVAECDNLICVRSRGSPLPASEA